MIILAEKYRKAKQWGIRVLKKKWLEDIIKSGKFLDESNYLFESDTNNRQSPSSSKPIQSTAKSSTPIMPKGTI